MFELHGQLAADAALLGDLPLCRVLLAKDSHYPWLILVPRIADVKEMHHLSPEQQQQLMKESCAIAALMELMLCPDKINIAALGNVVPQLHIHHIARFMTDRAWPAPIWGAYPAEIYTERALQDELNRWGEWLNKLDDFIPTPQATIC